MDREVKIEGYILDAVEKHLRKRSKKTEYGSKKRFVSTAVLKLLKEEGVILDDEPRGVKDK